MFTQEANWSSCTYTTIEVFCNYTKLAVLEAEAYVEKSKINLAKKLLPVRIEPGTPCDLLWYLIDWTNLALLVRLRLLRSLHKHGLLILAKSSKSESQLVHQQKWS